MGIARDAQLPHTMLSYGDNDSNGLLYNLYADCLLRTELVPRSVYEMQSAFYPTVTNRFGVPLDTRHESTKGDWEIVRRSSNILLPAPRPTLSSF